MKKSFKIEGVQIDLDALKASNPADLKATGIFSHLAPAKQDAAYAALQTEFDAYMPAPATVTIEKGSKKGNGKVK